ncbi:MAG: NUDIX domain-containing protein [Longicatena sp.]
MKYCPVCGNALTKKELVHEGIVAYCASCKEYRFPIYHSAVSMIVLNPKKDKILLIQQYNKSDNILVAGYINQGESGEDALLRELKEEIGRTIVAYRFLKSEYFSKSNTLLWNFAVVIDSESLDDISTWEIDKAQWFTFEEACSAIKQGSLAQKFLLNFMNEYEKKTNDFFQ